MHFEQQRFLWKMECSEERAGMFQRPIPQNDKKNTTPFVGDDLAHMMFKVQFPVSLLDIFRQTLLQLSPIASGFL